MQLFLICTYLHNRWTCSSTRLSAFWPPRSCSASQYTSSFSVVQPIPQIALNLLMGYFPPYSRFRENLDFDSISAGGAIPVSILIESIRTSLQRSSKLLAEEWLKQISGPQDSLLQLDFIVIILLLSISPNQKKIEKLVTEKVREKVRSTFD